MKSNFRKVLKYPFKKVQTFLNACMTGADLNTVTKGGNFQIVLNNMLSKTRYVSWCGILLGNRTFTQLEQLKSNS